MTVLAIQPSPRGRWSVYGDGTLMHLDHTRTGALTWAEDWAHVHDGVVAFPGPRRRKFHAWCPHCGLLGKGQTTMAYALTRARTHSCAAESVGSAW